MAAVSRVQPVSWSAVSLKAIPARHKDAWRFVLSTNMSGSLAVAGKQVMILLVGTFGGAYLAGGFRIANQLGVALIALAQTISKAILPELVHSRENALVIARRMANIAAVGGVIAVVPGRFGIAIFSPLACISCRRCRLRGLRSLIVSVFLKLFRGCISH